MRKRYPIKFSSQLVKTVYYPAELKSKWNNVERIAFGSYSCEAKIKSHPQNQDIIVISEDLKDELHFPDMMIPLHLFYENDTLFIGPIVGIFTSGFTPFPLRPIGDRSLFFSKLLSVEKSVGAITFVFGEQHINWEEGLIEGYFYHANGWEKHIVPFPNVVYDRLPNRLSENRKEQRLVKERMQSEYLIPWYNPGFFNKLDIYERLYNDISVSQYLPETEPFTSFSAIEQMLSQYGHVYIKPINGSLGLGVHQLLFDKVENYYYCRYYDEDGEKKLRKFSTLESLMNTIFRRRSLEKMIVQQGIPLLRYENRPIDFRIHSNKDANGNWQITAMAAKIAGIGSATTHVKKGGLIKSLDEIFNQEEKKLYIPKLREAALKLSQSLEKNLEGIIGEIGFDLGIDKEGNVWLFEANSKPGRSIFTHPQLKEFDLLTRKLSIAFAIFLTEKSIYSPGEIFK
ncbi:YheC/YheD family endospore coat-associated protein [Neobacillus sp. D3-1R]|uniref:YheC/YheD family endospore coat-associated protein n=1 Tax=Neobacillus sp. D3-1R TaxID=3445778 RepID=UPI003F9F12DC